MGSSQIPVAPVLTKERWVQCENPNCEKWRRIPHDAVIDADAPWYCYMNPDPERNTCSAAEEEYNDSNALVINDRNPEEAARNAQILNEIEASIAAVTAAQTSKSFGKVRKPSGGQTNNEAEYVNEGEPTAPASLQQKRARSVSFALDGNESLESDYEEGTQNTRIGRRQVAKNLQRIVQNFGQWENIRPTVEPPVIPAALPPEAWDALANAGEDVSSLACDVADLASSVRYFVGEEPSTTSPEIAEIGALARFTTAFVAAVGLANVEDSLTKIDRERLGLAENVELPPPKLLEKKEESSMSPKEGFVKKEEIQ